jgi:hypothetical protein
MAQAGAAHFSVMAHRLQRVALAAAITLAALNVWTGGPLAALWIGSRVQGEGPPSMSAIFTAALSLAVISAFLMRILSTLGDAYDRLTGTKSTVRQHVPWLRSMRGEREEGYEGDRRPQLTMLERILVVMVALAVLAFEIWFFFYSSSPIDQRTGRE